MLLHYRVRPLLVFDGGALPAKKATEVQRRAKRDAARRKAHQLLREDSHEAARQAFCAAVDVTPAMAAQLCDAAKARWGDRVDFLVAPYEADAQLAQLARSGQCDGVISEDSDNLPYGVPRTLFKLDATGQAKEIALQDLYDAPEGVNAISIRGWTHDMFVLMCCMSGCDYAESVDGVGVKKAHALVGRYRDFDRVLRALRFEHTVPRDYAQKLERAVLTFGHQTVFDRSLNAACYLTPLARGVADKIGSLAFLGAPLPQRVAAGVAAARLDPETHLTLERPGAAALARVPLASTAELPQTTTLDAFVQSRPRAPRPRPPRPPPRPPPPRPPSPPPARTGARSAHFSASPPPRARVFRPFVPPARVDGAAPPRARSPPPARPRSRSPPRPMLPSTKLRLGAPSQRRAPPPSPDKENPPPRKRPAPVDLSAFAFDRTRRPRAESEPAAAAALPAVRARDAARESGRAAAAAALRAVPLRSPRRAPRTRSQGRVSPVPSEARAQNVIPGESRAVPVRAACQGPALRLGSWLGETPRVGRGVARCALGVSRSSPRVNAARGGRPWTVLPRIAKRPPVLDPRPTSQTTTPVWQSLGSRAHDATARSTHSNDAAATAGYHASHRGSTHARVKAAVQRLGSVSAVAQPAKSSSKNGRRRVVAVPRGRREPPAAVLRRGRRDEASNDAEHQCGRRRHERRAGERAGLREGPFRNGASAPSKAYDCASSSSSRPTWPSRYSRRGAGSTTTPRRSPCSARSYYLRRRAARTTGFC